VAGSGFRPVEVGLMRATHVVRSGVPVIKDTILR
jgi:hypothetical protein